MVSPIGKYSGSKRLDPTKMKEPEADNEFSRKMWLEDVWEDEEFYEDVVEEINKYKTQVKVTANPDKLDIHIVGQSHIDMAWQWRYEQTHQKGVITFKKAILHAKMFPGQFTYAASEPVLIDWLMKDAPNVYEELQQTVKDGGIELVGGSWVEPDCMMPSGEAMVRQRLYGMRFYRNHFGVLPKVEFFLDSFGYNIGFPQILKKSGAEYFWTSKITWNRQTVFPFVNFWWEGPDGTQLLTSNFQQGWNPVSTWIRFEIGRHPIKEGGKRRWSYLDDYEDIDEEIDDDPENTIPPVGIFVGKGNGGHGPTHQEVAFNQAVVKSGWAHWSSAEKYFKSIEPYGDVLPIWADELYLEYHRGTFSVHFEVKRHNRYFENKLVGFESLASLVSIASNDYKYPVDKLEPIWKIVLLNQFHDVLPGSSIPEVYDDVWDMWQECNAGIDEIISGLQKANPVPKGTEITFSNPSSWKRTSPAFIPITLLSTTAILDGNQKPPYIKLVRVDNTDEVLIGQPVAAETGDLDDTRPAGWWIVPTLEAFATKCYIIEEVKDAASVSASAFTATETTLGNGLVNTEISASTGALLKLAATDVNDGNNLLRGDQSNLTVGFVDDFPTDHAWNIKLEYWKHQLNIPNDNQVKINVIDDGPVFATVEINRVLGDGDQKEKLEANDTIGANQVTQKMTLFKGCQELHLTYEAANWQQPWLMLKVGYDTTTDAEEDISDQSYCALTRSTRPEVRADKARYEKIMHKFVDMSTPEKKWGIAMLNEGKYAYDSKEGTFRLTMLRTPVYPSVSAEAWVNQERKERLEADGTEPPRFVDLGFLRCRYALLPHNGGGLTNADGTANATVKRAGDEFNSPIMVLAAGAETTEKASVFVDGSALLGCTPSNVLITSLKQKEWEPSENKIIRVVESCGVDVKDVTVTICKEIAGKITGVDAVDLLERPIDEACTWDAATGELKFSIGKFEIKSFDLKM